MVFLVERPYRLDSSYFFYYFGLFFHREQIRDLSVVQNITNLFHHAFSHDLGIAELENGLSLFQSCYLHDFLYFFNPIFGIDFVVLGHVGDVGGQHGQRLTSTTSDTYQQGMSISSSDHSHDLDHVLNGNHKQNQIHLVSRIQVVVLLKVRLTLLFDRVSVGQLTVDVTEWLLGGVSIRVNGRNETSPEQRFNSN